MLRRLSYKSLIRTSHMALALNSIIAHPIFTKKPTHMALALNSIIPHTTALSLSTTLPSPKMPSSPQFQQPHNRRQRGQIVQSAASSSSNIAVSDVKLQLQEEDHSNGFNPTSTFAPGNLGSE